MPKIEVEQLSPAVTINGDLVSTNPDTRAKYQVTVPSSHILDEELLKNQLNTDLFDSNTIKEHFKNEGRLSESQAINLLSQSHTILKKEPNLLEIERKSRVVVVGDIHGQYYDLLNILSLYDLEKDVLVFLGDYVDRGRFSTEVFFLLLALKNEFPCNIFLLRGNHETLKMTQYFTFREECLFKYSLSVYEKCLDVFCALPVAAVINNNFFCCHGGISPDLENVSDVNSFDRHCEPPFSGLFCDLLWSDPHPRFLKGSKDDFAPNTQRNCSFFYTRKGVRKFLAKNNLKYILRGHEVQPRGYNELSFTSEKNSLGDSDNGGWNWCSKIISDGKSAKTKETDVQVLQNNRNSAEKFKNSRIKGKSYPDGILVEESKETEEYSVVTLFSAPNYCDCYGNDGGVGEIFDQTIRIKTFKDAPHPFYLPSYLDAVNWSFPFVSEKASEFLLDLLKFLDDKESVGSTIGDSGLCDEIQQTTNFTKSMVILRTEREGCCEIDEESSELPAESIKDPEVAVNTFEEVKALDEINEKIKTDQDIIQALSVDELSASCASEVSKVLEEEELSQGIQNCTLDTTDAKTIGVKIEPIKEDQKTSWSPLSCFKSKENDKK